MDRPARRRVLVVSEGATLAHFAGAAAMAAALPGDRYEVVLASPEVYRPWVPVGPAWAPLEVLSTREAHRRMNAGRPLYDRATLERYVADDLRLFDRVRPEVVIGDGRLSLAASARKAGIPYIALAYAAWDPRRPWRPEPPCLPWTGRWPLPVLNVLQHVAGPAGFLWHAWPIARMLHDHGVRGVAHDIRSVWTEADIVLYADIRALHPDVEETPRRRFAGPVAWEPPVSPPKWWDKLPRDRPVVYLTLGSSGVMRRLPVLLGAFKRLDWTVMIATAGRGLAVADGRRLFVAKYLPGAAACARADVVISNGGSLTTTQALTAGKPVLGVCSNVDQFLEMQAVEAAGAGLMLRSDRFTVAEAEAALRRLIEPGFTQATERLRASIRGGTLTEALGRAIADLLGGGVQASVSD